MAELPQVHRGGAETQCYMIAQGLAERGHEVHYVLYHKPEESVPNVKIHQIRDVFENVKYVRIITGKWAPLSALRKADCDVYLQNSVESLTGMVGYFCRMNRKPFIYRAATEWHADLKFTEGTIWQGFRWLDKKAYKYGLKMANVIVCNSRRVADLFLEASKRFHTTSDVRVIPNGCVIPDFVAKREEVILCATRLVFYKRPEFFLKLALSLPQYKFLLCGRGPIQGKIRKNAKKIPNLIFNGFVSDMRPLYERAFLFVNPSMWETFPNVLIECGCYGVPYIGFVDPDGVIHDNRIGFYVSSFDDLVQKTRKIMEDGDLRAEMGRNIRSYVEKHHRIERTINLYEELFYSCLKT